MSALPKNLVPMPKQSQVAGIKSQTLEINPTNGSSSTVYDETNNRLIFQIGSIPNGFLNTKKSFLKFDLTVSAGSVVGQGIPIFNRMIVKTGSGSVLEDIQDLEVYDRLTLNMENYSTSSVKNALLGWGGTEAHNSTLQTAAGGTTYVKPLPSGVLGKDQEFYIPLHLMGSTYAFEVELQLAPGSGVVKQLSGSVAPTFSIKNVSLQLEVVNMPEDVCRKLDLAICGGEALRIPYSEVKAYRNNVPNGVSRHSVQTHEVSPNVEKVMTVIRPTTFLDTEDKFVFLGGKKAAGGTNIVDEYQYRYADRYAPLQPAKTGANSNGALANIVREVGFEAMPWFATTDITASNSRYAIDSFFLLQDFQTDPDLVSGLSTMAHASPIETYLTFNGTTSSALSLITFAKSTNALEISGNGVASKGMIM